MERVSAGPCNTLNQRKGLRTKDFPAISLLSLQSRRARRARAQASRRPRIGFHHAHCTETNGWVSTQQLLFSVLFAGLQARAAKLQKKINIIIIISDAFMGIFLSPC